MTHYVNSWPAARTRHKCILCGWSIMPGETYWRQATFDEGTAWTSKWCEHCERVIWESWESDEYELSPEATLEWLEDEHPNVLATLRAGWRYPDGARVQAPFGCRCFECGTRIGFRMLWCRPCEEKRLAWILANS